MNNIRRCLGVLAALGGTLLAYAAAAPAALATLPPPGPGRPAQAPPQIHTIVTGGTPGWQITLIAAASALLAAALAVLATRKHEARHVTTNPS